MTFVCAVKFEFLLSKKGLEKSFFLFPPEICNREKIARSLTLTKVSKVPSTPSFSIPFPPTFWQIFPHFFTRKMPPSPFYPHPPLYSICNQYQDPKFFLFSGIQLHDTCNHEDLTQQHLYHVISTTRDLTSVMAKSQRPPLLGKGPSAHDKEYTDEVSTNIRRRRIYNFFICETHLLIFFILVKDSLGFGLLSQILHFLQNSWTKKNSSSNIRW